MSNHRQMSSGTFNEFSLRCTSKLQIIIIITRALLRLERTMNLLEGGKGGEGMMGERGWGGDGGRGRGGEREGGEGRGGEGRGGEGRERDRYHAIFTIFWEEDMEMAYFNACKPINAYKPMYHFDK